MLCTHQHTLPSHQVLQLTASVFALAIVLLLGPLSSTFAQLAAFSVAYGLAYGATVAIHITVLAEVVGVHRLGSALGFFMLIRSSGGLLGPPIAGRKGGCFQCPYTVIHFADVSKQYYSGLSRCDLPRNEKSQRLTQFEYYILETELILCIADIMYLFRLIWARLLPVNSSKKRKINLLLNEGSS